MKSDFNIFIKLFIWSVIIRHAVLLMTSFVQISMAISGYVQLLPVIWNIVLSILIIGILLCLLNKKRWSLYLFVGLQLINVMFQSVLFGVNIWVSLFVAIVMCSVMAALLCLRKNGVSAWRLLFPKSVDKGIEHNILIDKRNSTIETSINNDMDNNKEDEVAESSKNELETPFNDVQKGIAPIINETEKKSDLKRAALFDVSLTELPMNGDGNVDYDNMTYVQQFAYTYKTESIETALKDLDADIKVLEKSIREIKKKLNSMQGGNRVKLRDTLRVEQEKLDELYELRKKYSTKRRWGWKTIAYAIGGLTIFLVLVLISIRSNNKTDLGNGITSDNNLCLNLSSDLDGDEVLKLYIALLNNGFSIEDIGEESLFQTKMYEKEYRQKLLNDIKNDFGIEDYECYKKRILRDVRMRWLYDKLSVSGEYGFLLDSYHVFCERMKIVEYRNAVYDIAVNQNLDVHTREWFIKAFE